MLSGRIEIEKRAKQERGKLLKIILLVFTVTGIFDKFLKLGRRLHK